MALSHLHQLARLDAAAAAAPAHARVIITLPDAEPLPLYAFCYGDQTRPALVAAAGVHGDEPEGVEAALAFIALLNQPDAPVFPFGVIVFPCLNPTGLVRATRSNGKGQDINRQFHADVTEESTVLRHFLEKQDILAVVDMHTDPRTHGFYLFELLREGVAGFASQLQAGLKASGHLLEPMPSYGGFVGHDGLLVPPPAVIAGFSRHAPGQSVSEWGWHRGVPRCYVWETPRSLGLKDAAQMHLDTLIHLAALLAQQEEGKTAKTG